MTTTGRLAGRGVLVTRPAAQAERLCGLIEAAGGRAIRLPVLDIEPAADPAPLCRLFAERWDLLVFVSRNAVELALALLPAGRLPTGPRLAAVGRATAEALAAAGRGPDLVPAGRYDSETLLALPELADVRGWRVLIVRGEGGRALLRDTLASRGAEVAYAEVYRRVLPSVDVGTLVARWDEEVAVTMATSDEALQNLLTLVGPAGRAALLATPLVVVAERTGELAGRLGFGEVAVAERADDGSILAACCALVGSVAR
ncbi:uroporphyrinogen-III synthase [Thioflavicoccus mobilis 8321]|uniref:Uroporphyrinogen-III synthase n=1 Tax=Thioflavicoccus mobilis 8321 TaxID=765912 RepID=L0GXX3_9GAMM|nr:uroporphyrinogen-III synthase [Thioflavicoccus mobilis]AGA90154.1 uroporphyrinogen-III synthase [Thioflavicoccus mobilis 8321]